MHPQVAKLVEHFGMQPLPVEGTLFVGTYRSPAETIDGGPVGTAMIGLYAHDPISRSLFHRLPADEVWHFYGGDPIRLVLLRADGSADDVWLGADLAAGQLVQYVIPAGTWQAGELGEDGDVRPVRLHDGSGVHRCRIRGRDGGCPAGLPPRAPSGHRAPRRPRRRRHRDAVGLRHVIDDAVRSSDRKPVDGVLTPLSTH